MEPPEGAPPFSAAALTPLTTGALVARASGSGGGVGSCNRTGGGGGESDGDSDSLEQSSQMPRRASVDSTFGSVVDFGPDCGDGGGGGVDDGNINNSSGSDSSSDYGAATEDQALWSVVDVAIASKLLSSPAGDGAGTAADDGEDTEGGEGLAGGQRGGLGGSIGGCGGAASAPSRGADLLLGDRARGGRIHDLQSSTSPPDATPIRLNTPHLFLSPVSAESSDDGEAVVARDFERVCSPPGAAATPELDPSSALDYVGRGRRRGALVAAAGKGATTVVVCGVMQRGISLDDDDGLFADDVTNLRLTPLTVERLPSGEVRDTSSARSSGLIAGILPRTGSYSESEGSYGLAPMASSVAEAAEMAVPSLMADRGVALFFRELAQTGFHSPMLCSSDYGRRWSWASDPFVLKNNAMRRELFDLVQCTDAIRVIASSLTILHLKELQVWLTGFFRFSHLFFELDAKVLLPAVRSAVGMRDHDAKRAFRFLSTTRDWLLMKQEEVSAYLDGLTSFPLAVVLRLLFKCFQELSPRYLEYCTVQERHLPPLLLRTHEPKDKAVLETKMLALARAHNKSGESVVFLLSWMNDKRLLNAWIAARLTWRQRLSYNGWVEAFRSNHRRIVELFHALEAETTAKLRNDRQQRVPSMRYKYPLSTNMAPQSCVNGENGAL